MVFYGEYLFDQPQKTTLILRRTDGSALVSLNIKIYQSERGDPNGDGVTDQVIQNIPVFDIGSNPNGWMNLPNQTVSTTTAPQLPTGHTIRANPFGAQVIQGRGILFIVATVGTEKYYGWYNAMQGVAGYYGAYGGSPVSVNIPVTMRKQSELLFNGTTYRYDDDLLPAF